MKKERILFMVLMAACVLSACGSGGGSESASTATSSQAQQTEEDNSSDLFTDRDMEIGYDEETSVKITLSGDSAACSSDSVQISEGKITITEEGTYLVSGTLDDGMIIIDAEDTDKVQLVLNGAQITSATSASVYILEADKVFITTASGTENTLSNGGTYIALDDNNIDGVIFSKADLTLNGSGSLKIDAAAGHGIVSKDDLVITSGTYEITAAEDGLSGKDSLRIAGGTFVIDVGDDAVHSDGGVVIQDGAFTISRCNEGIEGLSVVIDGGTFDITSEDDGINAAGESDPSHDPSAASSDIYIAINGGTFVIVSSGDCIDSNGSLTINGGTLDLTCNGRGNTALDCDGEYTNNGGSITTNDGSENSVGQMGGGRGGRGPAGSRPGPGRGAMEGQEAGEPGEPREPGAAGEPGQQGAPEAPGRPGRQRPGSSENQTESASQPSESS